jgi:hypothetical protein
MCKEAGLKANLILVDTRSNGDKHLHLPSMDFNHCISLLNVGDKKYYIELTDQRLAFANLPSEDVKANSLFIPREGDEAATELNKIDLPTIIFNRIERNVKVKFDGNDMTFVRSIIRWGAMAAALRADYADVGKEEREKLLLHNISSDFNTATKLNYVAFGDLKKLQDTAQMEYSVTVKKAINEVAGLKIIKLPWTDAIQSLDFVALEKRNYPFEMWEFMTVKNNVEKITVELPTGAALQEKPTSINLSCAVAEYHLNYDLNSAGKIIATREFKIVGDELKPTDYTAFKDFFNKVAEVDTKQIAFK